MGGREGGRGEKSVDYAPRGTQLSTEIERERGRERIEREERHRRRERHRRIQRERETHRRIERDIEG